MRLVINKVYAGRDPAYVRDLAESHHHIPVAGVFPLTNELLQLASGGLFCLRHPGHSLTRELQKVAHQVMG